MLRPEFVKTLLLRLDTTVCVPVYLMSLFLLKQQDPESNAAPEEKVIR